MAFVFDASVGTPTSNSLVSLSDAQDIIDATPNATAWGTDTSKQSLWLVSATSMLDVMAYMGQKTLITNARQWPRAGVPDPDYSDAGSHIPGAMIGGYTVYLDMYTIPKRMARGCVMLALEIAKAGTSDVWGVDKTANISKKTIDVIATEYVAVSERRFGLRVYPSVWREIYPLTMASQPASVERA